MFTKKITESDAFLEMPLSSQCLYFHLNMAADDDGFVNNPKRIARLIGASEDDLKLLIAKNFVILFETGIIVIKHWKMHNYIQSDRYKSTDYVEEKAQLGLKRNKSYTLDESQMYTKCIQNVRVGKDRLGKVSIGKDNNIEKDNTNVLSKEKDEPKRFVSPTVEMVKSYCEERNNGINPQAFIDFYESKGWMVGKNKMKDWKAAIRTWENKRKVENKSNGNQRNGKGYDYRDYYGSSASEYDGNDMPFMQ